MSITAQKTSPKRRFKESIIQFCQFLWPVEKAELKKLIPLLGLFFFVMFIYNLLRCLKISLVVKAEGSGTEIIPFLNLGAVLPGAVLLTYIFTVLMRHFRREQVFYIILGAFMGFFALFLFVLYPNHAALQLDTIANFLQASIFSGPGSKGFIAAIRHLDFTIFYVLAELWSAIVLSMLLWGFVNEVTKAEEAKRYYAIFVLCGNLSGIISGLFAKHTNFSFFPVIAAYKGNEWIFVQLMLVLFMGCTTIFLFWWLHRKVLHVELKPRTAEETKRAQHISLSESFAFLRQSRYLAYLVVIVIAYNIVYNLADTMLTHRIQMVSQTGRDVNDYMNNITTITGIVSVLMSIFVAGNVIRRFGWTITALITPLVWLITSVGFYLGITVENNSVWLDVMSILVANPANLVLFMASLQLCLGRGCKYTVFDETHEMAFIPLPREEQRKGKVIVDGLASRFGRSGGALIYLFLFYIFGEIANVIPYVSVIIFLALGAWLYATIKIGAVVDKALIDEQRLSESRSGVLVTSNVAV